MAITESRITLPALAGHLSMIVALMCVGCSRPSGLSRAEVHGQVILDGRPIPAGTIVFMPTEGNTGPTAGGEIKDGRFAIPQAQGPVVGKNRVELHSARFTGDKLPLPSDHTILKDQVVEDFPPRFNSQSELVRDVQAESNEMDFDVTTK